MKKTTLVRLKERHKGVILDIPQGAVLQNKLMSMGIYKGREITKISYIGLKGPVAIKVGRSVMVLGYGMANKIIVETQ